MTSPAIDPRYNVVPMRPERVISVNVEAELQTVHLTPEQLAHRLNMRVKTIYNRRASGGDLPPSINYMGRPRFRLADVIRWEESHLEASRTK